MKIVSFLRGSVLACLLASRIALAADEFTDAELERLRTSRQPDLQLGAGIRGGSRDDLSLTLLAVVASANRYLGRGENESYEEAVGSASPIRVPMLLKLTCRGYGEHSVEIADQCIELGSKLEKDAKTMIDALIVTAVEGIAYHHPSLPNGVNLARWKAMKERRKALDDLYAKYGQAGDPCPNGNTCRAYLEKFRNEGEIAAMKWFVSSR